MNKTNLAAWQRRSEVTVPFQCEAREGTEEGSREHGPGLPETPGAMVLTVASVSIKPIPTVEQQSLPPDKETACHWQRPFPDSGIRRSFISTFLLFCNFLFSGNVIRKILGEKFPDENECVQ